MKKDKNIIRLISYSLGFFSVIGILTLAFACLTIVPVIAQNTWWSMQGIPFTTNEFGNLNCDMLVNWNEIQKFDEFVVINNKIYANNSFDLIECRLNTIETLDKIERTWCCLKKV